MSAPLWLPGAITVPSGNDGGSMLGGPAKMTWHSYEADPKSLSAKRGAERLRSAGNDLHFVFNPLTGEIAQMLPANRAGRGLKNNSGGVQTNRAGTRNLQVEVIAYATQPFTKYMTKEGLAGLRRLLAFARQHGIPDAWPGGAPVEYRPSFPASHYPRSVNNWTTRAGHFSHSQVPENYHGDPGAIDVSFWKLPQATPIPRPSRDTTRKFILKRVIQLADPFLRGDDVVEVQKKIGLKGDAVDRVFGPKSSAGTLAYQKAYNKKAGKKILTEDGEVGPQMCKVWGWTFKP